MGDCKERNELIDNAVRGSQIYLHTMSGANLDSNATDVNNTGMKSPIFPTFPEAVLRFLWRLKRKRLDFFPNAQHRVRGMHKEAMKNFRERFRSGVQLSFLKAVIVSFINRVVEDDNAAVLQ
jgi:hypothetical protein